MSALKDFAPQHSFLLCIDSDGCAFDTMGIKHKECFCPAFIEHFGLQPVAEYARQAWEFVNLYSHTRGCNRFIGLERALDLLAARRAVRRRGFTPPPLGGLRRWMAQGTLLVNSALKEAFLASGSADLERILAWSEDVNARIARMVRGIPPFPGVREGLAAASRTADIVIVSATPKEALDREWLENGLLPYVRMVCGQEQGAKKEVLHALRPLYPEGHVLMTGDAPGDLDAAKANGVRFYPIGPAEEEAAWAAFLGAFSAFVSGRYHEEDLISHFLTLLPERPSWEAIS